MSYKNLLIASIVVTILIFAGIYYVFSNNDILSRPEPQLYDIDSKGTPKFIDNDFIESEKIEYVKRFRSGLGMNCPDDFESCRCMHHLFVPFERHMLDRHVKVFSPVDGFISSINQLTVEKDGSWVNVTKDLLVRVSIRPSDFPAFSIIIDCIDIRDTNTSIGKKVSAGEHIGYACVKYSWPLINVPGPQITIEVNTPKGLMKLSYFDVMTDTVFNNYKMRGANSPEDFIIHKEERDSDPLTCVPDSKDFLLWIYENGNIDNWVYLGEAASDFKIVPYLET